MATTHTPARPRHWARATGSPCSKPDAQAPAGPAEEAHIPFREIDVAVVDEVLSASSVPRPSTPRTRLPQH